MLLDNRIMYRWRATYRSGPPGAAEDETIWGPWRNSADDAIRTMNKESIETALQDTHARGLPFGYLIEIFDEKNNVSHVNFF